MKSEALDDALVSWNFDAILLSHAQLSRKLHSVVAFAFAALYPSYIMICQLRQLAPCHDLQAPNPYLSKWYPFLACQAWFLASLTLIFYIWGMQRDPETEDDISYG